MALLKSPIQFSQRFRTANKMNQNWTAIVFVRMNLYLKKKMVDSKRLTKFTCSKAVGGGGGGC